MSNITLYHGDCLDVMNGLPDASIDMVFTDPPYLREYLPLYGAMAQEAKRLLKPGAYMFCYGSTEHLPDHLYRMSEHLSYYWVIALLHAGGHPRMWNKKLMSGYKPVMVYTNGTPTEKKWMDTVANSDMMDKRYHKWGQGTGFPIKVISMMCPAGGVVLDPFLGGGTTGAAAIRCDRDFIGIEKDPASYAIAEKRIAQAQLQIRMEI
jgi:16S rRNA G966 N2-methylase RsmD